MADELGAKLKALLSEQLEEVTSARKKLGEALKDYPGDNVANVTDSYLQLCLEERGLTDWIETGHLPRKQVLTPPVPRRS